MDRWQNADDEVSRMSQKGKIARQGLSAFVPQTQVRQNFTPSQQLQQNNKQDLKIEVMPSKKVQAQIEDKKRMPPPPIVTQSKVQQQNQSQHLQKPLQNQLSQQQAAPITYQPPPNCVDPPIGRKILIQKDNQTIQEIVMNKSYYIFGRHPQADMLLEHQSISRQHAVILFKQINQNQSESIRQNSNLGKHKFQEVDSDIYPYLQDLGATHGTFLNGQRLQKNQQVQLQDQSSIQFGASTRRYVYVIDEKLILKKQRRLKFADEGCQDPEEAHNKLVQVIGYSDGSSVFRLGVGPQKADPSQGGKFQNLVKSNSIRNEKFIQPSQQQIDAQDNKDVLINDFLSQFGEDLEEDKAKQQNNQGWELNSEKQEDQQLNQYTNGQLENDYNRRNSQNQNQAAHNQDEFKQLLNKNQKFQSQSNQKSKSLYD